MRFTSRPLGAASGTVSPTEKNSPWTLPLQLWSRGSKGVSGGRVMNRRQWLYGAGLMAGTAGQFGVAASAQEKTNANQPRPLDLSQYEPKSMLQVQESYVARSRFPLIDFHTHISGSTKSDRGVELSPDREYFGTPEELLAIMDRKNIRAMVNLTGGYSCDP